MFKTLHKLFENQKIGRRKPSWGVDYRLNNIQIGDNFICKKSNVIIKGNNNLLTIGNNFKCNGFLSIVVIGDNNEIVINDNVTVVDELKVYCHDNSKYCKINIGNGTSFYKTEISTYDNESTVNIGSDCMFGYDTIVYNTDGHAIFQNDKLINIAKDLIVGNHVWCGWGSTILKNSYIADGCVVGKNAIVSGKFKETNSAIGGVPAKILKRNIRWDRRSVNRILEIKKCTFSSDKNV